MNRFLVQVGLQVSSGGGMYSRSKNLAPGVSKSISIRTSGGDELLNSLEFLGRHLGDGSISL